MRDIVTVCYVTRYAFGVIGRNACYVTRYGLRYAFGSFFRSMTRLTGSRRGALVGRHNALIRTGNGDDLFEREAIFGEQGHRGSVQPHGLNPQSCRAIHSVVTSGSFQAGGKSVDAPIPSKGTVG